MTSENICVFVASKGFVQGLEVLQPEQQEMSCLKASDMSLLTFVKVLEIL